MSKKVFSNQEVSRILLDLGAVVEVTGGNPFKVRAYKNAAEIVEFMNEPVVSVWERGELAAVKGIGKAIFGKLDELFSTGKSEEIDDIKSRVPAGMFSLLPLPGVGSKTAFKLAETFKLNSEKTALKEVKKLAEAGEIAKLEGFGEKSEQEILRALENYNPDQEKRLRIDEADALAQDIIDYLKQSKEIIEISALGSLRRRKETIGDIDIGVSTKEPEKVIAHVKKYPKIRDLVASGTELVRFNHITGQNVDVKILNPDMWGTLLQHFSGSKNHNVTLRERALKKGWSLSEHGIKYVDSDKVQETSNKKQTNNKSSKKQIYDVLFDDEKSFYEYMGLQWVPPEMREDAGEIDLAEKKALPQLIETKDIKGDFHTHTNYDWKSSHDYGADSMEAMVKKAESLGYQFYCLGDHNPSMSGYTEDQIIEEVKKRTKKIRSIKSKLKLLATLEVDITPSGDLALPDQAAEELDFVIASVHSSMSMPIKKMTERLLKAIAHPRVKIIGHPTGRLINKRDGYQLDWPKIFKACIEHQTALEINANPARLDLHPDLVKQAIAQNVPLAISTDAHAKEHLDFMPYGVDVARRGWAEKENVINSWEWKKLEKWLKD